MLFFIIGIKIKGCLSYPCTESVIYIIIFVFVMASEGSSPAMMEMHLFSSGAIMQQTHYYGNKSIQLLHNTLQKH